VKHVFKETNPMEEEQKINLIKPTIAVKRAKATAKNFDFIDSDSD
jgi:hypothetical protein